MKGVVLKKIKGILVLFFLGICFWVFLFKTPVFVIEKFNYPPSVHFSDSDVFYYGDLGKRPVYFSVMPRHVEKGLLNHPYVKSARVTKKLPDTLVLDIEYREELAAIGYSGLYVTIDETTTVLKVEESVGDIFLIDGFEFHSFHIGKPIQVEKRQILMRTIELISLLQNSHIESKPYIRYDNGIELLINDGYRVLFGKGEDIERKFNNFADIYEKLSEKGVNSGTIDVSHDGLPIYRPFGQ